MDRDLKIWYRLTTHQGTDPETVNIRLANTCRKVNLFAKNTKAVELALKIDPTKPYFIKEFSQLKVELDAIVRQEGNAQTTSAGKRVHYPGQTHDVGVGGGPNSNHD